MNKERGSRLQKRRFLWAGLRVALAFGIAFFICQIQMDFLEALFFDARMRARPVPRQSGRISLVLVDKKTQEELKRLPEALDYVQLFGALEKSNPYRVLYTQDFLDIVGSFEELERLADAGKRIPLVVVEDRKLPEPGLEEEFRLLPPLQEIPVISGPRTADTISFARDGVSRRLILDLEGEPLLHMGIANTLNGKTKSGDYRGVFDFKRTAQAFINYRPPGSYPSYSFIDVVAGRIDLSAFKDQIVIIGRDTRSDTQDYVLSPYSRDVVGMSRAEYHANILDTLILDQSPRRVPHWVDVVITSLIAILTVFVVLTVRPLKGLAILLVALAAFSLSAWALFAFFGIWIEVAHPYLAIFICYYFFIPYRLIVENRRSWEYYQRNALLTQVEELKSNFLRMMSHDLKTPLARIQGMAEMVMRESTTLTGTQQEALRSINQSSEELSEFVGSILSLGRIESKEIKLQLRSKDVNALLQEVMEKLQYLAKQKNIRIVTELEPMFSIKVDEDLLRQVFTNLIENAIKYSPENSSVLVTTEEMQGRVVVQIADQGIGIPREELQHLFTKFYRAKSVRDSIKGSGLGLYLARYFVDLHRGSISVESEPQKGSTFTVDLPMSL